MTTTTGAAPMSAAEVLAPVVAITDAYAKAMKDAGVSHYPEALAVVRQARTAVSAMAEREAALRAEVEAQEKRISELKSGFSVTQRLHQLTINDRDEKADEIREMRAEVEALRADAERYQELRSRMIAADFEWGDPATAVLVFRYELPVSANLDAMIDAARAEAGDV